MNLPEVMRAIQAQPYAAAISRSSWLFPFFETIHVLALSLVVGSVAMIDLRLLGIAQRDRRASELLRTMLPWTWGAFAVAATCGFLMFSSKAEVYFGNLPFRIKMCCLALVALNMLVFHGIIGRDVNRWDAAAPPVRVRLAGGVSLLLWVTIIVTGRWIGFTT